jgi:cryptochrome
MTNAILWFRKGLRLHDNPALHLAIDNTQHLYPIFILDPRLLVPQKVGANRLAFLLESLQDLDQQLKSYGSRLIVLQGKTLLVLEKVLTEWHIGRLCFERDTEPHIVKQDEQVFGLAKARRIQVQTPTSHTLYAPETLITANRGEVPRTYRSFLKVLVQVGSPPAPLPKPNALPPVGVLSETEYAVPTLASLNYPKPLGHELFKGQAGETGGLKRMKDYFSDALRVANFAKPDTDPTAFSPPATTVLGAHLHFGCLSARYFYQELHRVYQANSKHTEPPTSLLGQLYWREFFYMLGAVTPYYDRMIGNPICRQIPWEENPEMLAAWTEGRTGFPWIDAAMAQLRQEGWLHHLARHSVACFLTRGDLWISWEAGQAVFEQLLVDADWSINASNWMWLSASAFFNAYYRVYSPISFAKKYDPEGNYIRHYLPQLSRFPKQYIYEPSKAPLAIQREAQCVIGKDYPLPIVDHEHAKNRNLEQMKLAYGDSPAPLFTGA